MIENIQRSELNPIEEAEGYQSLINKYNYTQTDISKAVGKSRSYIANIIRLLSLSEMAKKFLLQKKITIGQVRPLIGHKNPDQFLEIILKNNLTSRQVEKLIKRDDLNTYKQKNGVKDINILNLEKQLSEITGLTVNIKFDSLKQIGSIKLECKSLSEFDYILNKIKS